MLLDYLRQFSEARCKNESAQHETVEILLWRLNDARLKDKTSTVTGKPDQWTVYKKH